MCIEEELKLFTKKISSDELLDKILTTYLNEMREEYFDDIEKAYQESKHALETLLSEEQKQTVKRMEELFAENMKYSMGCGFKRGLYAGFEHFFTTESAGDPFNKYVYQELLQMPNMQKHTKFYERKTEINKLYEEIQECLNGDSLEWLTTILCIFEGKELGVLRYSFYMGYRYALDIVGEIDSLGIVKILDKVLDTEYKLGFTRMGKEQKVKLHTRGVDFCLLSDYNTKYPISD